MKITLEDAREAEKWVRPHVIHTPIEHSENCSKRVGFDVYLKMENHQKTGSFKIRGAASKLSRLTDLEKSRGIIACSAGNHAQGVACVASRLSIKSTIVMPQPSPLIKVLSTKRFGAEIILHGASYDEAFEKAKQIQSEKGYAFIHPFEDPYIVAGQGTLGLELYQDIPDADAIFIPIGGGGLICGVGAVLKALNPKIKIYGVQAEGASSMAQSFRAGKLITQSESPFTIADGIAVKKPSKVMLETISELCDDVVTVNDDEIADAMVYLMERGKTVVEGSGVVSLAAIFYRKVETAPTKAVALLSGGNIDLNILDKVIDQGLRAQGRLVRIITMAPDVPGTLQRLTGLIAEKRANILQINHNRVSPKLHLRETMIEFTLETTGVEQIQEIKDGLLALGCKILDEN